MAKQNELLFFELKVLIFACLCSFTITVLIEFLPIMKWWPIMVTTYISIDTLFSYISISRIFHALLMFLIFTPIEIYTSLSESNYSFLSIFLLLICSLIKGNYSIIYFDQ